MNVDEVLRINLYDFLFARIRKLFMQESWARLPLVCRSNNYLNLINHGFGGMCVGWGGVGRGRGKLSLCGPDNPLYSRPSCSLVF